MVKRYKQIKLLEGEVSGFIKLHMHPYLKLFNQIIDFMGFFYEGLQEVEQHKLVSDSFSAQIKEKISSDFYNLVVQTISSDLKLDPGLLKNF